MTTPATVVQRQREAYDAHDFDAFAAWFGADARLHRAPHPEPGVVGRAAIATFHREPRSGLLGSRAELRGRSALGAEVVDHERVHGLDAAPDGTFAAARVREGRIADAWFFAP